MWRSCNAVENTDRPLSGVALRRLPDRMRYKVESLDKFTMRENTKKSSTGENNNAPMRKPVGIQADGIFVLNSLFSLDDTVWHCWKTRQSNRKELNPSEGELCWQTYFQPVKTHKAISSWRFNHVCTLSNQSKQRLSCFLVVHNLPHQTATSCWKGSRETGRYNLVLLLTFLRSCAW